MIKCLLLTAVLFYFQPLFSSPMNNSQLIHTFYTAFTQKDAAGMNACYHDEIVFEDPAFGQLKGQDAKDMWSMLCANATDLKIEYSTVQVKADTGHAHWEAWYTFSQTGRKVHNVIDAEFEFKDGKIIKHTDRFHLRKWAGQALGFKGKLLGGTKFFKRKLNEQTNKLLRKYQAK